MLHSLATRNADVCGTRVGRYHAPSACGQAPDRAFPDQVAIIMSMESSINYNCLDNEDYMKQFDIEMTYRLNSTVPLQYLREGHVADFQLPLVPFEEKSAAAPYLSPFALALPWHVQMPRLTRAPMQSTRWCTCRATATR